MDVRAVFQPDVAAINQIFKTLVAVVLLVRNQIFDSCEYL